MSITVFHTSITHCVLFTQKSNTLVWWSLVEIIPCHHDIRVHSQISIRANALDYQNTDWVVNFNKLCCFSITACAFWMVFGGTRIPEEALNFQNASDFSMSVAGLGTPGSLMFSLFRLTLVDDYDFDVSRRQSRNLRLIQTHLTCQYSLFLNYGTWQKCKVHTNISILLSVFVVESLCSTYFFLNNLF